MRKEKLSIQGQIDHLKTKGVKFVMMNEDDAMTFLSEHTYFFKIKAYAKTFRKYTNSDSKRFGQYIDLDFKQLVELSEIDMHLRLAMLQMTLEIEHALRVGLNKEISSNNKDDGYGYAAEFLNNNPHINNKITYILKSPHSSPYTADVITKYKDSFASWVLSEILSFGDFTKLYEFYYNKLGIEDKASSLLFYVKCMRNAAAHSNCMLNQLAEDGHRITPSRWLVSRYSKEVRPMSRSAKRLLKIPVIHDTTACLFAFKEYVHSDNAYNRTKELFISLTQYMTKKLNVFTNEEHILSGIDFLLEIIEKFVTSA